jgi:hypothetical protein
MKVIGGTVLIVFFILGVGLSALFLTRFARRDAAMGYFLVILQLLFCFSCSVRKAAFRTHDVFQSGVIAIILL